MGKAAAALALSLLLGGWLAWTWPDSIPANPGESVLTQPSAIPVTGESTRFDLDFPRHQDYLLIIGSLGDHAEQYPVELSSRPTDRADLSMLRALPEWRPAPRRRLPTLEINAPSIPAPAVTAIKERTFHLPILDSSLDDPSHYIPVKSELIEEGRLVRVYLDKQLTESGLPPRMAEQIVRLLDGGLLESLTNRLGRIRDVDGDGKFTVLLTPWLGQLQSGKTSLHGFVRESDFRTDLATPFSNRCDMLYLNSRLTPGSGLRSLLAHELTHAVCFSQRLPQGVLTAGTQREEDWLSEAIAHIAENEFGDGWSNLDYRVSRFLNDPSRCPLTVPDYYHAGLWRDHGCRGATFLFLRWCADQFGEQILPSLINSPATGTINVEQATGRKFEELFRHWSLALWQRETETNSGYRSINLHAPLGDWQLMGPAYQTWTLPQGRLHRLNLSGGGLAFVRIAGPAKLPQRIAVAAPEAAKLQLTLLPLNDLGQPPEVAATWKRQPSVPDAKLEVRLESSRPVTIDAVTLEFHHEDQRSSRTWTETELAALREKQDNILHHQFNLPVREPQPENGWVLKITGRDAAGKRFRLGKPLLGPDPDRPVKTAIAPESLYQLR